MKTSALCLMMLVMVTGNLLAEEAQPAKKYMETLTTKRGQELTFDMVLIPNGQFQMGSPADEEGHKDHEGPQRTVTVDSFYLCTTETTLALFNAYYRENATPKRKFFANDAQKKQSEIDAVTKPTPVYGDLTLGYDYTNPAMGMSWKNAVAACKWMSEKTGKTYRLPTEAEWEYACRAGSDTRFGGTDAADDLKDMAWYVDNSSKEPHEVATKKPNAFGLYDMMGNVREWVADFYSPTAYKDSDGPITNPTGPAGGKVHVARGGDHSSPVDEMRCADRAFQEPWWQSGDPQLPKSIWWLPHMDFIGFRVACSPSAEPSK
ncbi:MAG: formylglycine-generating enzyme family protein [Planctomycetes bacterium]|nr:formylglycine-generating enzyme family protein [Planctomycetota bacterium]